MQKSMLLLMPHARIYQYITVYEMQHTEKETGKLYCRTLYCLHPSCVSSIQWWMSRTPIQRRPSCLLPWSSGRTARRRTETVRRMRTPRNWKQCNVSLTLSGLIPFKICDLLANLYLLGPDSFSSWAISKNT